MGLVKVMMEIFLEEARNRINRNPLIKEKIVELSGKIPIVGDLVKDFLIEEEFPFDNEEDEEDVPEKVTGKVTAIPVGGKEIVPEKIVTVEDADTTMAKDLPCKVNDCTKKAVYNIGFCRTHYQKFHRGTIDSEGRTIEKPEMADTEEVDVGQKKSPTVRSGQKKQSKTVASKKVRK